MCFAAVSPVLMEDERIQSLLANPKLDMIHRQLVMTLYSLDASGRLNEYRDVLPLYLNMDWEKCRPLLDAIEEAGLITRNGDKIALTVPVEAPVDEHACGCG